MAFTHPRSQKLNLTTPPSQGTTPPPAYAHNATAPLSSTLLDLGDDDSDSDPDSETLSTIHLRIMTPTVIRGDNNIVSIDAATSASKIAMAVVAAIKQVSMGGGGVPMIDEEGRPRPIRVEVVAETRVEGAGNVVGEKAVVDRVVDGKEGKGVKRQREGDEGGEGSEQEGEAAGESEGKRVRTQ